ncbi:hypothetical protein EVAR_62525_1 [Eumeta japonica]|uniref:Uncharacterized protein n=1 Tax=Eumeta variegata TaxID=151549 RepID=A0A4C1ZJN6_EUMVA|nr:hypothetical protein EVAR_62525_1 [Eumeta japonica]
MCGMGIALEQLKNNKAPGGVGITLELLGTGGKPVLTVLQKLFNSVMLESDRGPLFDVNSGSTAGSGPRPLSILIQVSPTDLGPPLGISGEPSESTRLPTNARNPRGHQGIAGFLRGIRISNGTVIGLMEGVREEKEE